MSLSAAPAPSAAAAPHVSAMVGPRTDLIGALAWIGFGTAIVIASLLMDRLEAQDVNPYTIPGLMPGLLGTAMIILGAVLGLRSWRQGARLRAVEPKAPGSAAARHHLFLVLALCLTFGVGLVGHGLPFWVAAAVFVATAIPALQHPQRVASGQRLTWRALALAALIGIGASGAITIVFEKIFLVRLP